MSECARCGVSWEDHDSPCSMNLELQEANRTIDRLTKERDALVEKNALLRSAVEVARDTIALLKPAGEETKP